VGAPDGEISELDKLPKPQFTTTGDDVDLTETGTARKLAQAYTNTIRYRIKDGRWTI
jgi:hypothetical protein